MVSLASEDVYIPLDSVDVDASVALTGNAVRPNHAFAGHVVNVCQEEGQSLALGSVATSAQGITIVTERRAVVHVAQGLRGGVSRAAFDRALGETSVVCRGHRVSVVPAGARVVLEAPTFSKATAGAPRNRTCFYRPRQLLAPSNQRTLLL